MVKLNKKGNVILASIIIVFAVIVVFLVYENVSNENPYKSDKITGMATAKSCFFNFQCDDRNLCTTDRCFYRRCLNTPKVCSTGYVCQNGKCVRSAPTPTPTPKVVSTLCMEDDYGFNIHMQGTCKDDNGVYSDYCDSVGGLVEWNCVNKICSSIKQMCPTGYYCKEGECVNYNQTQNYCNETDGGKNIQTKGNLISNNGTFTDKCLSNTTLIEEYCNGSLHVTAHINCSSGFYCSDGACVSISQICIDSDGGINLYQKGTVSIGDRNATDYCYLEGRKYILEYYCSYSSSNVSSIGVRGFNCNLTCEDGACV